MKKDKKEKKEKKEGDVKNSTKYRKEWQAFGRWCHSKKRCPAKIIAACKDSDRFGQIQLSYQPRKCCNMYLLKGKGVTQVNFSSLSSWAV